MDLSNTGGGKQDVMGKAIVCGLFIVSAFQMPVLEKANDDVYQPPREQITKLELLGKELAGAVLRKDVDTVLRYDRPDLIEADRPLFHKKSDLYCYVFDTTCIKWKAQSVNETLARMKSIAILAKKWGKSADGHYSYLLVFYDRAKYSRSQVLSERFVCSHSDFATWTFNYINESWQSVHPPFDAETDALCSSE